MLCVSGVQDGGAYTHTHFGRAPGGGGVRCIASAARRSVGVAVAAAGAAVAEHAPVAAVHRLGDLVEAPHLDHMYDS